MDAVKYIETAFGDSTYPGDQRLFKPYIYELDPTKFSQSTVVKSFFGKQWHNLSAETLQVSHPIHLSIEGARYYLPAMLIAILKYNAGGEVGDYINDYIFDDVWEVDNHGEQELREEMRRTLSQEQQCAVVVFLKELVKLGRRDYEAQGTLNGGWRSIAERCMARPHAHEHLA